MRRTTISVNVRISTDGDVDGDAHRMQRCRNGKEAAAATTTTTAATAAEATTTITKRQISKTERINAAERRAHALSSKALRLFVSVFACQRVGALTKHSCVLFVVVVRVVVVVLVVCRRRFESLLLF